MKKTSFYNALSNDELIENMRNGGKLNLFFLVFCIISTIIFKMNLTYMNIHSYRLNIAVVSCIVIMVDSIIGFIVIKFIKTKHKTLLILSSFKYFMFVFALFIFVVIMNFIAYNDLNIHIIIFVVLNLIFIPINYKVLKNEKNLKESKLSIIAGGLIPISGIIGMWVSRFFRSTGNESITLIMLFYLATFLAVIMQKIFIVSIWQYRNYEKVYTKELVENWIRLEKKRGEDDPKRSYY